MYFRLFIGIPFITPPCWDLFPPFHGLEVLVIGGRSSGKSAFVRAASNEAADYGSTQEDAM